MASTSASHRTASASTAQTVLPDEILEEIFLRLDAAADLVSASATCSSFRRVVSARRFLRRFRSLQSPPILGFIRSGYREFLPVGPPHRSVPEAHALVQAADLTFSFLPDPSAWLPYDARDGRVLFVRHISTKVQFRDFLVFDPLHRWYVKIPRIPVDHGMPRYVLPFLFLAPAAENDREGSFRVICTVHLQREDMAFVFSSCNQTWQGIVSTIHFPSEVFGCKPYYAHGCLYWMVYMGYSLMLDTSEMKFSIIDLPPHNFGSKRAIVEAADGRLGFLTIGDGIVDLYCKNRQSNGVGAQEWQHDKLIPLPKDSGINYNWNIVGTAGRYVALRAYGENCYELRNSEYFVLDMKTLLLEKLCTSTILGFPYARFPPLLGLPSV